ncbi:MAG: phage tail tape measure protein [Bacteroidaceae bacterium]|nr:phage tail tape measure protein [Bacteroidaceae bacterium]
MAARNSEYNMSINCNAEQVKKEMQDLLKANELLRKKKLEARNAGDIEGAKAYGKAIDANNRELKKLETNLTSVKKVLSDLSGASLKDLKNSLKLVSKEMEKTPRNTERYRELTNQMKQLKTEIAKVGVESKASTSIISKIGVIANRFQAALWGLGAAVSGLSLTIRSVVQNYSDMEEQMANVEKYTGLSTEAVHEMNEEFKKMDTRTSREQLNKLAGDAGRLGIQSKEAIKEFVDGADKIQVALGDDLGENAVKDIGKLAQMFGEDKTKGLRGAMLATGSAVNELAQNSSAAAGYIVDFTARMSGVGKQAGLTQAQIMGYGSVLDQNMQNQETAATALSQLLTKMMQDTSKFAALAGQPVKEFAKTLREDANKALLQFLEAMNAKGGFSDLAPMFEGMGLNGSRATGILSVLADKLQDVKTAQDLANSSYEDGTSVLKEYDRMNTTVQAEVDKAKKRFHDLSVELGEKLLPIAKYTISSTSLIVNALSTLIEFVFKFRSTIVVTTLALALYNAALIESLVVSKLKIAIDALRKAFLLLNTAIKANPLGIVITAATATVAVFSDLTRKTKELSTATKQLNNIERETTSSIETEMLNFKNLVKVVTDVNASTVARETALKKLKEQYSDYLSDLTLEKINTEEAKEAIDRATQSIILNAKARALQAQIMANEQKLLDSKQKLENGEYSGNAFQWFLDDINVGLDKAFKSIRTFQEGVQTLLAKGHWAAGKQNSLSHELIEYGRYLDDTKGLTEANEKLKESLEDVNSEILNLGKPHQSIKSTSYADPKKVAKEKAKEERERAKREAAFRKETKEHDNHLKAETQREIALLMDKYAKGEILARDYQKQLYEIQEKGLKSRIDYLMTRDIDAANSLKDDLERLEKDKVDKLIKIDAKAIEKGRKAKEIKLKGSFYDTSSDMYMNEVALNEALFQNDLEALTKRQGLYKKNSEEWLLLEEDIKNMESQHSLEQKERYFNLLMEMTERYGKADYEIQQKIAEDGLKMLHSKGLVSEKEYQEMLLALKAEYASRSVQHTGDRKNLDNALTIANAEGNKAVSGNINQDSIGSTITRWQAATAKLKEIYESDKITYAAYQQGKAELNAQMLEGIVGATQGAYDSINNIMSAAASYAAACSSHEEAMIKKKYQTDIDKAKDGSKKKKKLEEKRDKEIAVAKKKANKKAMNIEIAQAIASTAMAAINSYASASKISWVLGPIAAAMATAAGMLQIATIKKQHQAEEAGYYEGGFTGGNKYRREAGVVHEGEFVANHKAVGNSNILPVLNLIDKAQKNNTVGSLTAEDVSRSVGTPGPMNIVQVSDNAQVTETIDRLSMVIDNLQSQLEEGITAIAAIDGERGIAKQLKRYNNLLKNK